MIRTKITILLLSCFMLGFSQETELKDTKSFLIKIASLSKETKTISADFIQEKELDYLKEKQVSSGKFYTAKGNMRWEQTKPNTYIMLISDEGVKIKEDDSEKEYGEMAAKFMDQIRSIMLSSINGDFADNKDFTPTYFENKKHYLVKLKPQNRRLSKMFKSVHLSFDKNTYRLKVLSFVQEDGISKMFFSNEVFNTELNPSIFTQF